jgi:DNA-binding MarR family transcriptional regulator
MQGQPEFKTEALQFMQRLWQLAHSLEVRSKRMARDLGVTGPQRLVIRLLGHAPNITANEISTTLGMHPSTLTGILSRLETQHIVVRTPDPSDGRRARFHLAKKGMTIDQLRSGKVEAAVRRTLARSSDAEVATALGVIEKLAFELAREDA